MREGDIHGHTLSKVLLVAMQPHHPLQLWKYSKLPRTMFSLLTFNAAAELLGKKSGVSKFTVLLWTLCSSLFPTYQPEMLIKCRFCKSVIAL